MTPVGFEPTTSGLNLPVLYRLSYEASTGAGQGNLGSEFAVIKDLFRKKMLLQCLIVNNFGPEKIVSVCFVELSVKDLLQLQLEAKKDSCQLSPTHHNH